MRLTAIIEAGQETGPVAGPDIGPVAGEAAGRKTGLAAVPEPPRASLSEPRHRPPGEGPRWSLLHCLLQSLAIPARFAGRLFGRLAGSVAVRVAGGYAAARASCCVGNAKATAALTVLSRISLGGAKALLVIEFKAGDLPGSERAHAAGQRSGGQRFLLAVNADAVTGIQSIDSHRPQRSPEPSRGRLLAVRRLSGAAGRARTPGRPRRLRSER